MMTAQSNIEEMYRLGCGANLSEYQRKAQARLQAKIEQSRRYAEDTRLLLGFQQDKEEGD